MRPCPFCESDDSKYFGKRFAAEYRRCVACRSIFMDAPPQEFEKRHDHVANQDGVDQVFAQLGSEPSRLSWRPFADVFPPDGSILEIGPGSGHLLAAAKEAGHEVCGIETSPLHRRAIAERWGITSTYESLANIPPGQTFTGAILINVLEHIYDPIPFMRTLAGYLRDGAAAFISTVNAGSFTASLLGTKGVMFKPEDHVSFPSARSMQMMAERAGLIPDRLWTHEFPLESPFALALALRDYMRERGQTAGLHRVDVESTHAGPATHADRAAPPPARSRRVHIFTRKLRAFDPLAPLLSGMGKAASVKALLRRPSASAR